MTKLWIVTGLLVLIVMRHAAAETITEGEPYPDFVLPRIDNGDPVSRVSLTGKPTLLIHFASW